MAESKQYIVKHYTFHNGKRYRAGSKISLSQEDALPLLAQGLVTTPSTAAPVNLLSEAALAKLNVKELTEYGSGLGVTFAVDATRENIIAAISGEAAASIAAKV